MLTIPEFPRYMIDRQGNVHSCIVGRGVKARNSGVPQRQLKAVVDPSTGYLVVNLTDGERKVNRSIHRLLAQAYIPNLDNLPHVNHKDGVKTHNALDNLEWVTTLRNTQHAIEIGVTDPKLRHPDMTKVVQLCPQGNQLAVFDSLHEAGRQTGVAWQNISKVLRGLRKSAGGFTWATSNV